MCWVAVTSAVITAVTMLSQLLPSLPYIAGELPGEG